MKPKQTTMIDGEQVDVTNPADIPVQEANETPATKETAYDKMSRQVATPAETLAVIHSTVAKGTTPAEFLYFMNVAKAAGLNPFQKEIWCYKDYKSNLIVMTGRDGFMTIAQRHPKYSGFRSGVVCENDEFENEQGSEGVIVKHKVAAGDRGKILGAWCIAYRTDAKEFFEWVDFADYNKGKFTWETNPKPMIQKVAESHALKKAYGVTGLASAEDFDIENGIAVPVSNEQRQPLNK